MRDASMVISSAMNSAPLSHRTRPGRPPNQTPWIGVGLRRMARTQAAPTSSAVGWARQSTAPMTMRVLSSRKVISPRADRLLAVLGQDPDVELAAVRLPDLVALTRLPGQVDPAPTEPGGTATSELLRPLWQLVEGAPEGHVVVRDLGQVRGVSVSSGIGPTVLV